MENWKDIPGYEEHYQCSDLGQIKSLCGKTRILKSRIDKKGYCVVILSKNGLIKGFKIHQLVAITFLGHKQCGMKFIIDHIDGNKTNNVVSNLQIVTNRQNCSICFRKNKGLYSSKYVGVTWDKTFKKWHSRIRIGNKQKHLGYFNSEEEASESYKVALSNLFKNTI